MNADPPHVLIVISKFYEQLADMLLQGAEEALKGSGATHDVVTVPGALEVPAAIAMAAESAPWATSYDGYVALGIVIRGETPHFDHVCTQSAAGLMTLTIERRLPIGNGILTVENGDQARVRADPKAKDKGGEAAKAALTMITLKRRFAGRTR